MIKATTSFTRDELVFDIAIRIALCVRDCGISQDEVLQAVLPLATAYAAYEQALKEAGATARLSSQSQTLPN